VHGKESSVSGIDPATIGTFYTFNWSKGSSAESLETLSSDGALVTESYAKKNHLAIGSRLDITTPSSNKLSVVVRGIYDPPSIKKLLDPVSIGRQAFDGSFPEPKNKYTFLNADSNADSGLKSAAKSFGDADLHTGAAYPKDATKDLDTVLAFLYVLLGFSVIVSLFGMVNTMVLSVFERTRELGMLRTIGMTRRPARRMIRHESIITALIGAALGLGLGTFLAAVITNATADNGITFSLPVQTLVGFTLIAVVAGIGAAIAPARRASKLNVLHALQYE
jgi:putative ABC transport system permease protein